MGTGSPVHKPHQALGSLPPPKGLSGSPFIPLSLVGNGITLEGAVPSEQDSQPKPAKRARTSFTAEQLQVGRDLGGGRAEEGGGCQFLGRGSHLTPLHSPM